MNHLDILGNYENFNYVLYSEVTEHLMSEYERMFLELKNSGFVITSDWDLTGGILLEDSETKEVAAGIFFNTKKFDKVILVHLAYVSPEHRKKGIYTKLHSCLDKFGSSQHRTEIYSYIHLNNKPMVDYIGEKIGYVPLMQLVTRPVKSE